MKKLVISLILALSLLPASASALQMPGFGSGGTEMDLGYTAKAYVVIDVNTGKVLVQKNAETLWPPASLTKLVTAMVVLDLKPKLTKTVAMAKADEVGGARLATKAGVKYTLRDLLYASLVASTNNGINASARSTGLSREKFVERMNQKAKDLGATQTVFYEPSGIDEKNQTTADDYAKIAAAAYKYPLIADAASRQTYSLTATNNRRYSHNLKNTNKLLGDSDFSFLGKTGYLEESQYNFASLVEDLSGNKLAVVVLGSQNSSTQFKEARELAALGHLMKSFDTVSSAVLGTSVKN